MAFSINTNIASENAQRQFRATSRSLAKLSESLASGTRINRASDDAAGLAIAESLSVDRRVFLQGVRNVNDAVNATRIADGALSELNSITIRIQELAQQASNGTLGNTQREALDAEGQALRNEFNRIVTTTKFNDLNFLNSSIGQLSVQSGDSSIDTTLPSLVGFVGDGTFQSQQTIGVGDRPIGVASRDINRDGNDDILTVNRFDSTVSVLLGNGDGTFQSIVSYAVGADPTEIVVSDFNNDGSLDFVTGNVGSDDVTVLLGAGDGTFSSIATYDVSASDPEAITLGDVNGDGISDILTANEGSNDVSILFGNSNGTFQAALTVSVGNSPNDLTAADLNGDNFLDLITADDGSNNVSIRLGNGDGTFGAQATLNGGDAGEVDTFDVNNDGILDLFRANRFQDNVEVYIGNGDGTFLDGTQYTTGQNPEELLLLDTNGDNAIDIVTSNNESNDITVLLGNADGTFSAAATYAAGDTTSRIVAGDFNGDGVDDLVASNAVDDTISLFFANSSAGGNLIPEFSLTTQADALDTIVTLDSILTTVNQARSDLGSFESRLNVATTVLEVATENYAAAESQIRDVAVAQASAELTKLNIQQQAATAILAQANQQPSIALRLLNN